MCIVVVLFFIVLFFGFLKLSRSEDPKGKTLVTESGRKT